MNEFVLLSNRINIKNGKLIKEILRNFKIQWLVKKILILVIIFFKCIYETVKKIIETGPTKWLQSKDSWISERIRHFN